MKTEKEKMLSGELYLASDPELFQERTYCRQLLSQFNQQENQKQILKQLFGSLGKDYCIKASFHCDYGYNISIGERFYANYDCIILDVCRVIIGQDCFMGPGVHIYTANHPLDFAERSAQLEYGKPVVIGDQVWIGGRAIINPGITIGNQVVVASGSVVTKNVPSGVLVGGNPARIIKQL